MEGEAPQINESRDWCAIVSTFVVACTLALIGVSLLLQGDPTTGIVLVFVGCGLMLLSMCGAAGKCKVDPSKVQPQSIQSLHDRPPSYRVSWRRSFLRRHRHDNYHGRLEEEEGEAPHTSDQNIINNAAEHFTPVDTIPTQVVPQASEAHSDTQTSRQEIPVSAYLSPLDSGRHTQSLSNLLDPPPYEQALAKMDQTQIRKLKSEINLPSLTR